VVFSKFRLKIWPAVIRPTTDVSVLSV